MITMLGTPRRCCDGLTGRETRKAGALGLLSGFTLPNLRQAEEARGRDGRPGKAKSVILLYLLGGAATQDMIDLKPDAPAEIRGEFKPIATSVPGIQICELLPGMARMMDRLAIIRSMVGSEGHHSAFQCMHGRTQQRQPGGGWPSLGSTVSKLQGPTRPEVPPFVGLSPRMTTSTWSIVGEPGFLGRKYAAFKPNAEGMGSMVLKGMTLDQLGERRQLVNSF